ncbi:MAG: 4Fe-4S binding protein [Chitinispirillaceae bacterium]|nr:4Fe-4S binding protein [Chitinispirillaceae bacterium]
MPLTINRNECDRCGTCISVCPCNALLLVDELRVIHDQCTRCGTCVAICPVGALEIEQ